MIATILTLAAAAGAVSILDAIIGGHYARQSDRRTARAIARLRAAR